MTDNNNFLHQSEAAVNVPAKQALLVTGASFVLVLSLNTLVFGLNPTNSVRAAGVVSIVTGVVFLFWRLYRWDGMTAIQQIEEITGLDINQDGAIGKPLQQSRGTLRVEHRQYREDGTFAGADYVEENADLMFAIADALYNRNIPFSVGEMVTKHHVITRAEYDTCIANWIKADGSGYLEWKNAKFVNLGCRPTKFGAETFRAILAVNSSPTGDK